MIKKFNPQKTKILKFLNFVLSIFFHKKKLDSIIDIKKCKKILIIDPTLIGDIVMLIPFLQIIRKNTNDAKITLVCNKWAKDILHNQGLVDDFIFVDSKILNSPWAFIRNIRYLKTVYREINREEYDVSIEPRGDLRYIFFMHYCRAKRKVSYNYTGGERFLTDIIIPSNTVKHLVEDKLFLAQKIGCDYEEGDKYPKLYLDDDEIEENDRYKLEHQLIGKTIIGIHPGASLEIKQWKHFDRLLERLNNENIVFIIFEGPKEEEAVARVRNSAISVKAQFITSKTDIRTYVRRLAICNLVICNDSGAGHIATALGVPTCVIFGPIDPELAKPYVENEFEKLRIISKELECKPCLSTSCKHNKECIDEVTTEEVFTKVMSLLD